MTASFRHTAINDQMRQSKSNNNNTILVTCALTFDLRLRHGMHALEMHFRLGADPSSGMPSNGGGSDEVLGLALGPIRRGGMLGGAIAVIRVCDTETLEARKSNTKRGWD
jgi:hypothetical protein